MKLYWDRRLLLCAISWVFLTGCVTGQPGANWGANTDDRRWISAARDAARDPQTWVPALTAGLLLAADVDKDWSEELAQDQPLFGDRALQRSNDLRDLATVAYVASALAAPSASTRDKLRGLGVGAATMLIDGVVTEGLKRGIARERPGGENRRGMPSGHASKAASRVTMARHNLRHLDMPAWAHTASTWTLQGIAAATGIARVEGGKHYLADVLLGYATGHFVAETMQRALLAPSGSGSIAFTPVEGGGMLTLTIPLR